MYKSSAPDIPETNYTIQISSKYSVSVRCTTVDWDVTALEDDKKHYKTVFFQLVKLLNISNFGRRVWGSVGFGKSVQ